MSFSHNALTLGADVLRKVPSNMPKYPDINHFLLEFGWVLHNRNSWIWVVLEWSYKKLWRGVCHYQIWLALHMCHWFEISAAWGTGFFQPGSCTKVKIIRVDFDQVGSKLSELPERILEHLCQCWCKMLLWPFYWTAVLLLKDWEHCCTLNWGKVWFFRASRSSLSALYLDCPILKIRSVNLRLPDGYRWIVAFYWCQPAGCVDTSSSSCGCKRRSPWAPVSMEYSSR